MNAARFARNLVEDGVEPKLAQSLAEHLADEIDRTVATKEHVEMVVTREVQQLRVEMHEEFQRFDARITDRLDTFQDQMTRRDADTMPLPEPDHAAARQPDALAYHIVIVLFLAMLGNIIKDFLR